MTQLPFVTSNTNTATFLILQHYNLLGITYEPRPDGKKRGFFIFEHTNRIKESAESFEKGNERVDFTKFENQKNELIDRIVRELP